MSSLKSRAKMEKEEQNWLRIAVTFPKICEFLSPFVDQTVTKLHDLLLGYNHGVCSSTCLRGNKKKQCNICKNWSKSIKSHYDNGARLCWENSDPTQWATNSWELAKVFMAPGQRAGRMVRSVDELDVSAMFSLMLNCKEFGSDVEWKGLVKQVLDIRNKVFHMRSQKLQDALFDQMQATLIRFLEVGHQRVQDFPQAEGLIQKIAKLQEITICITEDSWLRADYSWKTMMVIMEERLKEVGERQDKELKKHGAILETHEKDIHELRADQQNMRADQENLKMGQRNLEAEFNHLKESLPHLTLPVPGNQQPFINLPKESLPDLQDTKTPNKKHVSVPNNQQAFVKQPREMIVVQRISHTSAFKENEETKARGKKCKEALKLDIAANIATQQSWEDEEDSSSSEMSRPFQSLISIDPNQNTEYVHAPSNTTPWRGSRQPRPDSTAHTLQTDGFADFYRHPHCPSTGTMPSAMNCTDSIQVYNTITGNYKELLPAAKTRVLVLFLKDNPAHVNTVHCFCEDVLRQRCCDVVTLSDYDQTSIHFDAWIAAQFKQADKILIIFSKGARKWPDVMLSPRRNGPIDKFWRALKLVLSDFNRNKCGKYLVAYFEHSSYDDVIQPLNDVVYRLMERVEALVFKIHDFCPDGPGFHYEIPTLRLDENNARGSAADERISSAMAASMNYEEMERRQQKSRDFDEDFREVSNMSWGGVDESMTRFFAQSDSG